MDHLKATTFAAVSKFVPHLTHSWWCRSSWDNNISSKQYTAISRKVVGESARDNPEKQCGLFWVRCSSKKFERMAREAIDVCLRILKESNNRRFDGCSVRNSVLIISHVTFRDCCVHIFSDNLSQNSRMLVTVYHKTRSVSVSLTKNNNKHTKKYNMKWEVAETIMFSKKSPFTKKCSNFGLFIFSDVDFYWLNTPGITV